MSSAEASPGAHKDEPLEFAIPTSTAVMDSHTSAQGSVVPPGGIAQMYNRLKDSAVTMFRDRKPWVEFLDRTAFSKPASMGEVSTRVQKNMGYYRTNYLIFLLATMALTFLTNPKTLIWTGCLLSSWVYLFLVRTTPLLINGREYSEREKLIGMSVISFVVVFFLTNVGAIVLYGASLSLGVVALHGAFREPDDLFLDDGNAAAFSLDKVNIFQGVQAMQAGGASQV